MNDDCRWNGPQSPRNVPQRHEDSCVEESCTGCLPCPQSHCRVCRRTHADGTCAECLAETRDALREIGRLCGGLPEEVEHRGIEGEAMMLLGPAADPEAIGHIEASIAAGRIPRDYLEKADHELHPLFIVGTWDMVWRDALEHDEPTDRLTITTAIAYLDQQLSYMAGYEHVPFEDFARDLRQCRAHLEAVLHDGVQVDTGAPCMTCGVRLERTWGKTREQDGWGCPRCKRTSTEAQYALAVRADYEQQRDADRFDWLPILDCIALTGATRGTITGWASKKLVGKRRGFERTEYRVGDIRDMQKRDVA